ncbi:MAG: hypothetical protein JNN30_06610 [Rhodanobacteraceae bacterium]|nr:hypothetical protein [Rhodanobacteraceae bacterium]
MNGIVIGSEITLTSPNSPEERQWAPYPADSRHDADVARSHQESGTDRLLHTPGLLRLDVGAATRCTALATVSAMTRKSIRQFFEAISSGSDDAISSAIVDLEYDTPSAVGSDVPDAVFECIEQGWKTIVRRASGTFPVVFWFCHSYNKFSAAQKERARTLLVETYGSILNDATALEVAEWFGTFADETSLRFAEQWLDRWPSMTDAARFDLDGFFDDSFDPQKNGRNSAYSEQLSLLERRYDTLRPRNPLSLPRH